MRMTRNWTAASLGLALLAASVPARAQQERPHIGFVHPAGGQRGTVCEVAVGGQHLEGASGAHVSGQGVRIEVIEHWKPPTRRELVELREQLQRLRDWRRNPDSKTKEELHLEPVAGYDLMAMDRDELMALRDQLEVFRRQPNPQIAERVVLRVTVAPDAACGGRDLRLITDSGLSNPLRFCVDRWPEVCEQEPNDEAPDAVLPDELPAIVNGQILPGDVDRFRFRARRGQRLVAAVSARDLIPYVADAVPGWLQATLALTDAGGNELAYSDDHHFHPDPVLYCEIPEDGEYVLEIKDSIYRGREDFVYRIALGELPFVSGIFPLGGRAGEATPVTLSGWNLPVAELALDGAGLGLGVHTLSMPGQGISSSRVCFEVEELPDWFELEPNDAPQNAQRLALPLVVNGRIDRPGDRDVFRIEGRAGDELVAEVRARRLGSPLDSLLRLTDEDGAELARNDDHADPGAGLTTHQADSRLSLRLPASGTFFLLLDDAQSQGGPDHAYRLRVSPPRPDFELRVVPSSVNVRAGANAELTVHALRRDGFDGEIALDLRGSPPGFDLSGGLIPAGRDELRLTLQAPAIRSDRVVSLRLVGRAVVGERRIRRLAVPAQDRVQAFVNHHLVPATDLVVAVQGQARSRRPVELMGGLPVRLVPGGTAEVRVRGSRKPGGAGLQLELSEPPAGISIREIQSVRGTTTIVLAADASQVEAGSRGNLIVEIYAPKREGGAEADRRRAAARRPLGILPAIPFEIADVR